MKVRLPLWNGLKMLLERPLFYVVLVLLAPALVIAIPAAVASPWLGLAALVMAVAAMWAVQFFLFL
jgi:hypothetical protein